jgi:hypothetical protein
MTRRWIALASFAALLLTTADLGWTGLGAEALAMRVASPRAASPAASPSTGASPVASPRAQVSPVASPRTEASGTLQDLGVGGGNAEPSLTTLKDMLPAEDDVPEGLVLTEDRARTLEQVSGAYGDPTDMMQRFEGWGWQGNVVRTFAAPDGAAPPLESTTYLSISIDRFGSPAAAADAIAYAIEDELAQSGLEEVLFWEMGDQARAIAGTTAGGNEVIAFVQRRNEMIVVDVVSPRGDPMADAVAVAETILTK